MLLELVPFNPDPALLLELARGGAPDGKILAEGYSSAELARARAQVAAERHVKRAHGQQADACER
jgi:hypothetical protein